tara:strand:- start:710 stop:1237 length:528 start_codon:yes stop_codon:yes gene_type:complete
MPTPSTRTPLRIARGTYANLNGSVADIQEGEICYATDQDKLYVKESGSLVATGAIANNAVLNAAQTFTAAQRGAITALTDGATITPDFAAGNNYSVTLGGNRTLANPTNLTAGQSGVIMVSQDSSGSRTLAFGNYWKFAGGTAPTLTTTASAVDVIAFFVDSTTRISAQVLLNVS